MPLNTLEDAAALFTTGADDVEETPEETESVDLVDTDDGPVYTDKSVRIKDGEDFTEDEEVIDLEKVVSETVKPDVEVKPPVEPDITAEEKRAQRQKELDLRLQRLANNRKQQALAKQLEEEKRAFDRQRAEFEAAKKEADAHQEIWRSATKDPVAAFRKLGLSPTEAFDKIAAAAQAEDTPESREAKKFEELRNSILEQFRPVVEELERLKGNHSQVQSELARRAQLEAKSYQKATEAEFVKLANTPDYEELADYYEEPELIALGNQIADEMSSDGHKFQNGIKDVLDELASRLRTQLKRAEERRSKRTASTSAAATTPKSDTKAPVTTTIGNNIAGSSATAGKRPKTADERRLDAVKHLKEISRGA